MNGQIGFRKTVLGALVIMVAALAALGGGHDAAAEQVYTFPDQKGVMQFEGSCVTAGGTVSYGTTAVTCTKGKNWIRCETGATDCTTNVPPARLGGTDDDPSYDGGNAVAVLDPAPAPDTDTGERGPTRAVGTTGPGTIVATEDDPGTADLPVEDRTNNPTGDAVAEPIVAVDDEPATVNSPADEQDSTGAADTDTDTGTITLANATDAP